MGNEFRPATREEVPRVGSRRPVIAVDRLRAGEVVYWSAQGPRGNDPGDAEALVEFCGANASMIAGEPHYMNAQGNWTPFPQDTFVVRTVAGPILLLDVHQFAPLWSVVVDAAAPKPADAERTIERARDTQKAYATEPAAKKAPAKKVAAARSAAAKVAAKKAAAKA